MGAAVSASTCAVETRECADGQRITDTKLNRCRRYTVHALAKHHDRHSPGSIRPQPNHGQITARDASQRSLRKEIYPMARTSLI